MPRNSLKHLAAQAALDALAVLLPVSCAGCSAPDRAVCIACRSALDQPFTRRRLETESDAAPETSLEVVAALPYEGVVRRCLLAMKAQGRTDVTGALAAPLGRAISAALETHREVHPDARDIRLCPIPQGAASARLRGYDPVRILARRSTGGPVVPLLRRTNAGPAQKLLGVEERRENARGSLRARGPLDGVTVLLVDDVVTSGATLLEASRAIRAAGATVVGAAVLAATPLRSDYHRGVV